MTTDRPLYKIPYTVEHLEEVLRTWLGDDAAAEIAAWIVGNPEAVADVAYDHYTHHHGGDRR